MSDARESGQSEPAPKRHGGTRAPSAHGGMDSLEPERHHIRRHRRLALPHAPARLAPPPLAAALPRPKRTPPLSAPSRGSGWSGKVEQPQPQMTCIRRALSVSWSASPVTSPRAVESRMHQVLLLATAARLLARAAVGLWDDGDAPAELAASHPPRQPPPSKARTARSLGAAPPHHRRPNSPC